MGGDRAYPFPKHVHTPSGGWWFVPRRANFNASLGFLAALGFIGYVGSWSSSHTETVNYVKHTIKYPKSDPRYTQALRNKIAAQKQEEGEQEE